MVRLAQEFAQRYPLVDGQGNFGNVDGDNAAAMRYTEARLTEVAQALLDGIDEDTVDFRADLRRRRRGAGGPAGGLPQPAGQRHQRHRGRHGDQHPAAQRGRAVRRAVPAARRSPRRPVEALLEVVKGPDLPTGGVLVEPWPSVVEAYRTGRGSLRLRARWQREDLGHGQYQVVVTEIPYQVPKSRLIERIAELLAGKQAAAARRRARRIRRGGAPRPGAARAHRAARAADGAAVPPDRAGGPAAAQPERARRRGRAAGDGPRARCCARSSSTAWSC